MFDNQLTQALQSWKQIPLTSLNPRRALNLADKKADWKAALATLQRFTNSPGYQTPFALQAHAALENYWGWQAAGQEACHLLIYGLDLGLPGNVLRPIYLETVALWKDTAAVAHHARASMSQTTGEDYGVPAPINARSAEYKYAVILMALAVLLDAPEEIPAIVEQVLAFDTDRLLDYLSAAAIEVQEVNETLFHPRPYGALLPFFELLGEPSPEPLVAYVQTQYADFLRLSPSQQKKGKLWLGTFFWALEVGALSVLYGWDDVALRDLPHYPADLVDFANARSGF
ncbi:DUF1911 domain-containing protein [Comamonas sp. Y33R10-2]|uniref:PoNe immunity protein domain-containing protein n=1 Tax=Comamonas sp. Y33R10-2 TaxID=2853257 RepID=UPI001C5CB54C|nr:PoNe immunity protein domain-containing protein [Comamonas sp. Y33R10-2]QXZ08301.1 DUF1911 domain-containing protein [Comamonas sp. Y33R10-2]